MPPAVKVKTLTSATNPEAISPERSAQRPRLQRGFTLIELIVVIAIMGLLVGLVPVAYGKVRESTQYRSLLRTITADMRRARQNAQAVGQPQAFVADLNGRKVGLQGQSLHDVPQPLQIKATVGNEQLQDGMASIVFLPSGGATGGSIEIIRPNKEGTRLRVDWLSGQVTQERLLP